MLARLNKLSVCLLRDPTWLTMEEKWFKYMDQYYGICFPRKFMTLVPYPLLKIISKNIFLLNMISKCSLHVGYQSKFYCSGAVPWNPQNIIISQKKFLACWKNFFSSFSSLRTVLDFHNSFIYLGIKNKRALCSPKMFDANDPTPGPLSRYWLTLFFWVSLSGDGLKCQCCSFLF